MAASLLGLGLAASSALSLQFEIPDWDNAVAFQVVASQDEIRPGDSFEVALIATIREGYHLYGPEEVEPSRTVVTVTGEGLEAGKPSYPPVLRRDLSGLGEFDLYEGEVAVRVPVKAAKTLAPGKHVATFDVKYQICTDYACSAPTSDTFDLALDVAPSGTAVKKIHPDIFKKN